MNDQYEPIAIVGMGVRVPEADDVDAFWRILEEKRDMTRDIPKERFNSEFWCSKEKMKGSSISFRGGFIDNIRDFDAPFFNLSANEARELDPQIRLLLETAWFAMEDAGVVLGDATTNGGVFIGHMTHDYMEVLSGSRYNINSHCMQGNAETMAANRLSYFFNLEGPSVTYNTACSSSLVAVHSAVRALQNRECKWAIAGGANALLDPRYFVGFTDWGTMSPDGHSFSFDSRGNGYVRCEGAGIVVLKTLTDALQSHDRIYAVIRGSGVNHDGNKPAITNPRQATQQRLLERVCRESHTDPATIVYSEAHGTGTVAGDKTEAAALSGALCQCERAGPLYIGSLKSNFGHMEGAAGVASLIKGALCVWKGMIPATIKVKQPSPSILWDQWNLTLPLEETAFPASEVPRRVTVSSFGIGGTNACFILEQSPEEALNGVASNESHSCVSPNKVAQPSVSIQSEATSNQSVITSNQPSTTSNPSSTTPNTDLYILLWTAKSESALQTMASKLLDLWKCETDPMERHAICWTLTHCRTLLPERAAVMGTAEEVATALEKASRGESDTSILRSTSMVKGSRPLAFVFCGQGAQWKGMGSQSRECMPVYWDSLQRCARVVKELGGWDLVAKIDSDEVNGTRVSQPATTAVQVALVDQLRAWGLTPTATVGHSSGEIAAAYAAGAVTLEEAVRLAFFRGSTIDTYSPRNGGMAAVGLTETELLPYLQKYPHLCIACYNSPSALTVSGDKEELAQLCSDLRSDNCFCRPLVVTHAFHSPFMAPAMPAYKAAVETIHGRSLTCRMFSSLRGCELEEASQLTADYFVENLTSPVRFPDAVASLAAALPNALYVEVGPHPTLQRPLQQCLQGQESLRGRVIGTLDRRLSTKTAIARCIGGLLTAGVSCPQAVDAFIPASHRYDRLPHYPFERKTLWLESEQSYRFRYPQIDHPILGVRQPAPIPTWENDVSCEREKWLLDHVISGSCLAPGALYLDTAIAAACSFWGVSSCSLSDCVFLQALILPAKGHVTLRTTLDPESGECLLYHRDSPEDLTKTFSEEETHRWTLHFRCTAKPEPETWVEDRCSSVVTQAESQCKYDVGVESLYYSLQKKGLEFGPQFKSLERITVGPDCALCSVRDSVLGVHPTTCGKYCVHPALLDTLFQSLIGLLGDDINGSIPRSIQSLTYNGNAAHLDESVRICTKRAVIPGLPLAGDVWMMRGSTPFISCRGVQVVELQGRSEEVMLSEVRWSEVQNPLDERVGVVEVCSVTDCYEKPLSEQWKRVGLETFVSRGESVNGGATDANSTTFILSVNLQQSTLIDVYTHSLYPWAKAFMEHPSNSLVIVTCGALLNAPCPTNASLLGFARSIHAESPALPMCFVDLDPSMSPEKQQEALMEVLRGNVSEYKEMVHRCGRWLEPQVQPFEWKEQTYREPESNRWSLQQRQEGSLDSYKRCEIWERPMGDDDVCMRVYYAGLNYKDVMIAIGLLKGDAFAGGRSGLNIGLEASGVIEAVGKNVKHVRVGDEVFGLLDHGLATHTVTEGCYVYRKPAHITLEQAACLFVPYTTAYATVVDVGKASPGQVVLIHGAAGGVGSAAVQLAHNAGCTVIATVSNKKKEEYVRRLGADYVFNSRSCTFAADVRNATKGKGCDLILNCLSGRSMQESLRLLAPFGRFIEIGKTDAMARHRIGVHELLENGTYVFFDTDRYFQRQETTVGWVREMVALVEKGELNPPPTEVFPLKQMGQAIRRLSAGKHIGKVILQLRDTTGELLPSCKTIPFVPSQLLRPDRSYVLVGGTGGLGMTVATWLASHGARHLLLLSRSGRVHSSDQLKLLRLQHDDVDVVARAVDASDMSQLTTCLDSYLESHPPVSGVFHTAMLLRDGLVHSLQQEDIEDSLSVKVTAGWNLHTYFASKPRLDLFVVFSSVASLIGNLGQSNYSIGNTYLEGLIASRRASGLAGTALILGGVYDAGAVARNASILNESLRSQMVSKSDVLLALEKVVRQQSWLHEEAGDDVENEQLETHNSISNNAMTNDTATADQQRERRDETNTTPRNDMTPREVIIFPFDKGTLADVPVLRMLRWSLASSAAKAEALLQQVAKLPASERTEAVTRSVKDDIAMILGLEASTLRGDQPLSSLGIDSILAVELKNKLDTQWQMSLPVFELTSGKSVSDLIEIVSAHIEKMNDGTSAPVQEPILSSGKLWKADDLLKQSRSSHTGKSYEEAALAAYGKLRDQISISTDFAERFDWLQTRESVETHLYLSQLPWNPYFFTQCKTTPTVSTIEGYSDCINYTAYDYLGLCTSPEVKRAAEKAIEEYGTSVSASRLAGGQIPLHNQLEQTIAAYLGVESSIVMLGGHTCNLNTLKCLMNRKDLVLYDELAHNSIMEGAAYCGSARKAFRHNDWKDLETLLSKHRHEYEKVMICIEGVYSMDGDIPDLPQFIRIKQRFNCILFVDEAHSIGVLGETGRGLSEHFGIDPTLVDLWMGSLGKAFASAGGYIAGSKEAIQILRYRAPGFVYSIGMPPAAAGAALEAFTLAKSQLWRIQQLRARTQLFKKLCEEESIDIMGSNASASAVIPVMCGSTERCIEMMRRLREEKVLVSAGMYPAVASGQARLRFFVNANHTEEEIRKTVKAIKKCLVETMCCVCWRDQWV